MPVETDFRTELLHPFPQEEAARRDLGGGRLCWAQLSARFRHLRVHFQDGSEVKVQYSFVYVYEDSQWMISHHHSSLMSEEVVRPKAISESELAMSSVTLKRRDWLAIQSSDAKGADASEVRGAFSAKSKHRGLLSEPSPPPNFASEAGRSSQPARLRMKGQSEDGAEDVPTIASSRYTESRRGWRTTRVRTAS
ncbi:hypothetical protein ACHAWF_004708 [Thalassiosira exigua]